MEEELQHTSDAEGKKRNLKLLQIVTVFIIYFAQCMSSVVSTAVVITCMFFYTEQRYS